MSCKIKVKVKFKRESCKIKVKNVPHVIHLITWSHFASGETPSIQMKHFLPWRLLCEALFKFLLWKCIYLVKKFNCHKMWLDLLVTFPLSFPLKARTMSIKAEPRNLFSMFFFLILQRRGKQKGRSKLGMDAYSTRSIVLMAWLPCKRISANHLWINGNPFSHDTERLPQQGTTSASDSKSTHSY